MQLHGAISQILGLRHSIKVTGVGSSEAKSNGIELLVHGPNRAWITKTRSNRARITRIRLNKAGPFAVE